MSNMQLENAVAALQQKSADELAEWLGVTSGAASELLESVESPDEYKYYYILDNYIAVVEGLKNRHSELQELAPTALAKISDAMTESVACLDQNLEECETNIDRIDTLVADLLYEIDEEEIDNAKTYLKELDNA